MFSINAVVLALKFVNYYEKGQMYTWILVSILCTWKIETLFLKWKYQKLQIVQL